MFARLLIAAATVFGIASIAGAASCFPSSNVVVASGYGGYNKKVVVEKVVVPVIAPVAVYAPVAAYSAVYVPAVPVAVAPVVPAAPVVQQPSEMMQVLNILKGMDERLKIVEAKTNVVKPVDPLNPGTPAPTPAPATPAPTKPADPFNPGTAPNKGAVSAPGLVQPAKTPAELALTVVQARCASCHDATKAAEKGGGLTLIENGGLAKLSDRAARRVLSRSYAGTMPPPGANLPALTDNEVSTLAAWIDSLK
jgi:hypothetical protein